jgi:HPt (histidine-containing phosphotransfer) domain-containing protein
VSRIEEKLMSTNYVEVSRCTQWELLQMARLAHADDDGAASDAVDMAVLLAFEEMQVEGEPDLIVELINLYLEDAPVKLASMQEAAAEGDEVALKRVAHSLRGSSASIGVGQVAALCEELERAYRADSAGQAVTILDRLEQELEEARRDLEAERRRRT